MDASGPGQGAHHVPLALLGAIGDSLLLLLANHHKLSVLDTEKWSPAK